MNTDLGMRPRHQNWRQRTSESARGFEYGFGLDSYCEKFQETLNKNMENLSQDEFIRSETTEFW
jgi:hypothetical protein